MRQLQGIFGPLYLADGSVVAVGEAYIVEYDRDGKGNRLSLPITMTVRDLMVIGGTRRVLMADTPKNLEAALQLLEQWEAHQRRRELSQPLIEEAEEDGDDPDDA